MPKLTLPGISLEGVPVKLITALLGVFILGVSANWLKDNVWNPQKLRVEAEQAQAVAERKMNEFAKHYGETPLGSATLHDDARGKLSMSEYTDRCIIATDAPLGKPSRSSIIFDMTEETRQASVLSLVVGLEAAGRCVADPHPGKFRWWYGQQQGCLVPLWREWADGCLGYLMFNSCSGVLENVTRWQTCNH